MYQDKRKSRRFVHYTLIGKKKAVNSYVLQFSQ